MESLSDGEILVFATVFVEPRPARQVLADAGWPTHMVPAWGADSGEFWREVSRRLAAGVEADGRRRLFLAALERYPANAVFAAGAGAVVGRLRRVPPVDLLPVVPARFVPREADTAVVRGLLRDGSVGQVVALVGMGGVGKSTLAAALARDPAVVEGFPDGVAWVGVGQDPLVAEKLAEALEAFGDPGPVRDVADGTRRLRGLLTGARALVVLDDVWDVGVLEAFRVPAGVRLLVTTRSKDQDTLFGDATVYDLAEVDEQTARRVLASYAGCAVSDLPAVTGEILARCGGLVLALALVGAMVGAGRGRWETVARRLRRADLAAIAGRFAQYPHPSVLAALDVSVRAFPDAQVQRFREFAVFEGLGPIPEALVVGLWQTTGGLEDVDAEDLIGLFARNSLVQVDPVSGAVRLHGLLFEYARGSLTGEQVRTLHGRVAHWLLGRWGGLATQPPLSLLPAVADRGEVDRYGLTAVVTHLLAADDPATVDLLLAAERPAPGGRFESVWYVVHEDQGSTATYLAAVHAARAGQSADTPAGLARHVGYALLLGSITSLAAKIPPALLGRLVQAGLWPAPRALAYAQAIPDPSRRAEALATLVGYLPTEQRGPVLTQALAAATAIDRPDDRAEALAGLVEHLPTEQRGPAVAQALTTATA
ncbi:NB-ARC domain-containing protein, partial [Pseudofrankia sp. BMG5.36]|uniref:NB-ARC domain-containing protein n=1 Tax=Pseudofrankia sp. BMG5.36 TaxID=1834512 RepID=UPI0018E3D55B